MATWPPASSGAWNSSRIPDREPPPILLFDTYSLFYRAYFALPPLTTRAGEPTSALYGIPSLILKLFRELRPAGATFAVNLPGGTFRHRRMESYKANRVPEVGGTFVQQLARFRELVTAFGFPVFGAPGFEADDVLATLARELDAAGEAPIVVTGDHDALQVARGGARVYIVSRGGVKDVIYDAALVKEKIGVPPERVPDWIALTGDPSDNLPGVRGIGDRGAVKLIAQYGGVEAIVAHAGELPPRVRAGIEAVKDDLLMWLDLARVRDELTLAEGPRYGVLTDEAKERLRVLFGALEFESLIDRLMKL